MPVRRSFIPGSSNRCSKLIQYIASQQANKNFKECHYINDEIISKASLKPNISNAQRISQVINNSVGGKTFFGNYYLGEPVVFNYLGRVEGQPGGSGMPLRNKF